MTAHVLLLAGTREARVLAQELRETWPGLKVTASLAGAVERPEILAVPCRIGGFGGIEGLVAFIRRENVTHIIDATHPFAARISQNAAKAASISGSNLVRLERPAWTEEHTDTWQHVKSVAEAAQALPDGARAFLSIGRKDIDMFKRRGPDLYGLVRMIDPPASPLPDGWDLVLARPSKHLQEEAELFEKHRVTHVVSRNSGGQSAFAKIAAARLLGLQVVMIERPRSTSEAEVQSVADAIQWLKNQLAERLPTERGTE